MSAVEAVEVGEVVSLLGVEETVQEACEEKGAGRWVCATHGDTGAFQSNWAKDDHLRKPGKHRLAWLCLTHNAIEKP